MAQKLNCNILVVWNVHVEIVSHKAITLIYTGVYVWIDDLDNGKVLINAVRIRQDDVETCHKIEISVIAVGYSIRVRYVIADNFTVVCHQ